VAVLDEGFVSARWFALISVN